MLDALSEDIVDGMSKCLLEHQFVNNTNGTNQKFNACDFSILDKKEGYITPLWESDFPLTLFYCCLVGVCCIVGTFGNIVILVINIVKPTVNKIGRGFIINLTLADLCVTAVVEPMCVIGVIKGEKWLQRRWWLCEVVASMCLTACLCTYLSLTIMTVNRYVYVCHHTMYSRIFNRCSCLLLCLACWVVGFFIDFPNFVGWADHIFDGKSHQCIWSRTASLSYTLFMSIALTGCPLFIMGACFVLVFVKIWKSKLHVYSLNKDDPLRMRRVWTESFRASMTLAIVCVAFVVCWMPYAVVVAVDVHDEYSVELHLFVTLLAHVHSSLCFIIYMASNKNFRQSVNHVLCCAMVSPLKCISPMATGRTTMTPKSENSTKSDVLVRENSTKSDVSVSETSTKSNVSMSENKTKSDVSVNSKTVYYIYVQKSPIDGGLIDGMKKLTNLSKLPDSQNEVCNTSE